MKMPDMSQEVQVMGFLKATARILEEWRKEKKPGKFHLPDTGQVIDLNDRARNCALEMEILADAIRFKFTEVLAKRWDSEKEKP